MVPVPYSHLDQPNYRMPLSEFFDAECALMDSKIMDTFERNNPDIKPLREEIGKGIDMVVVSLHCHRVIEWANAGASTFGPLLRIMPGNGSIKMMLDRIEGMAGKYGQFIYTERAVYQKVADKIHEVGDEKGLSPSEISVDKEVRNEVVRRVFPERIDAEKFINEFHELAVEGFAISPELYKTASRFRWLGPRIWGLQSRYLLRKLFVVPDFETSEKFLKAAKEYCEPRLNEIYGD